MKFTKTLAFATLLGLVISLTLPINNFNRVLAQQIQPPQTQELTPQQIKELQNRTRILRRVRAMLLNENIAFNPNLLFTRFWRVRLSDEFNQLPQMQTNRVHSLPKLKGVQIANELSLPEEITLDGDTVILARKVKFRGQDVKIKGPYSLHLFVTDSVRTRDGGGTITIDTSGRGRKEWLELRQQQQQQTRSQQNQPRFLKANYSSNQPLMQDSSGQPGADGTNGQNGNNGQNGGDGANGADGTCNGTLDGIVGGAGEPAVDGDDADDGYNGGNGEDGGDFTHDITDPSDTTTYNLVSKGGDGGRGGNGGFGGFGGNGGRGGNGGKGASCSCAPGGLGNGGNGGNGGARGTGGDGGDAGDGGNGGKGGNITINYPAGYNPQQYITTNVQGGTAGAAGQAGTAGQTGQSGQGGTGGEPGSLFSCTASRGTNGNWGGGTGGSQAGAGGSGGNGGASGNVYRNQVSGGGGGTFMVAEPQLQGSCYDWVTYHCPCGNYSCCYEVSRTPAGCW